MKLFFKKVRKRLRIFRRQFILVIPIQRLLQTFVGCSSLYLLWKPLLQSFDLVCAETSYIGNISNCIALGLHAARCDYPALPFASIKDIFKCFIKSFTYILSKSISKRMAFYHQAITKRGLLF